MLQLPLVVGSHLNALAFALVCLSTTMRERLRSRRPVTTSRLHCGSKQGTAKLDKLVSSRDVLSKRLRVRIRLQPRMDTRHNACVSAHRRASSVVGGRTGYVPDSRRCLVRRYAPNSQFPRSKFGLSSCQSFTHHDSSTHSAEAIGHSFMFSGMLLFDDDSR